MPITRLFRPTRFQVKIDPPRGALVHRAVKQCRICGTGKFLAVLDLGVQALTGVFPATREQAVTEGPLKLVKCTGDAACCGLLQSAQSYDRDAKSGGSC